VKPKVRCAVAVFLLMPAVLAAQAPDFSGTWKLDPNRSRVAAAAALSGLIGAGAPDTLHITQPANGTVVIESQINEGHARLYRPGDKTSTPVFVGPAGSVTMTSRWDGRSLVSEGTRDTATGTSTTVMQVKEVITLSADGRTLAVDVTTTTGSDTNTSTAAYTRTQDVGPCQSWPTPCKSFSR
jgi:hypothetical protein